MKRWTYYLGVAFFAFFSILDLSGQIGIKTGFGISDIAFKKYGQSPYIGYENNSLIHEKPILSFQAGIFLPLDINRKWTLQPEILFATKGIDYSKNFLFDDITYKINISYLEIPVILKYQLSRVDKWLTGIYLGPYAGLKLLANRNIKVEGIVDKVKVNNVKSFDFGSLLGLMVSRQMTSGELSFDLRIGYGLINMMDYIEGHIPEYDKNPDAYARNVSISISVGYLFDNILNEKIEE